MDDGGPTASILLFLGLLLLEAYCYGFGAAIHGLNEKEVERKAIEENDKRSLLLSRLVGKPSRYVNTVQLVVTFLNLCMGGMYLRVWSSHIRKMLRALAERQAGLSPFAGGLITAASLVITVILLLYILLVFGTLIPKKLASRSPEKWAYRMIKPVSAVMTIFTPLTGLFSVTAYGILKLFGMHPDEDSIDVTEEEIQEFIDDAREELQVVDLGGGKKSTAGKHDAESIAQGEKITAQTAAPDVEKSAPKKAPAPQSYDNSTAKITALRVDDRLIHGQVAMTWTKQLAVQGIVVANDEAANDNTQKMALKMAVPGGIKSLIKPVDEAIRILNNPKASRMRILVLTRTVKDALKIRQSVGEIGFLNVGNTGRFDGIDVSEKLVLTPTIMLTKAEQQALKDLVALEPKTCMQQVPNDEQKLVKDVLDKLN